MRFECNLINSLTKKIMKLLDFRKVIVGSEEPNDGKAYFSSSSSRKSL